MENGYKCCFTGYRPNKFPFELESKTKAGNDFDNRLFESILELAESGVTEFYSGMAMGFDIIAAETVLDVRELRPDLDIRLTAAIPFIAQSDKFSPAWKSRYNKVLSEADNTVLVSDNYFKGCYQKRNVFMVDNSDVVLTYFDGKSGGTKNTIEYARKLGRKIINLART